jgi:hypothetical protein
MDGIIHKIFTVNKLGHAVNDGKLADPAHRPGLVEWKYDTN